MEKNNRIGKTALTAIIKTNNSEKTIIDTLESLSFLDEVIVVDENSTDDTPIILKEYKTKTIFTDKFETKNVIAEAINAAKNDWIFIVEDDEIIPKALLDEINNYISSENIKKYALALSKKTFYRDNELKFLKNNKELRVFKKGFIELKPDLLDLVNSIKPKNTRVQAINKNFKIKNAFIIKTIKKNILEINQEILENNRFKIKSVENFKNISIFVLVFLRPLFVFIYFYFIKGAVFSGEFGYIYSILKAYDKFIFEIMKSEKQGGKELI